MNYQTDQWAVDLKDDCDDGGYELVDEKFQISQMSRKLLMKCTKKNNKTECLEVISAKSAIYSREYLLTTSSMHKTPFAVMRLFGYTCFDDWDTSTVSNNYEKTATKDDNFKEHMLLGAAEKKILSQVSSKLETYKLRCIATIVDKRKFFLENPVFPLFEEYTLNISERISVPTFQECLNSFEEDEPMPEKSEGPVADEFCSSNARYWLTELMPSTKSISAFHVEPIWIHKDTQDVAKIIEFPSLTLPQLNEPFNSFYKNELFEEDCDERVLLKLSYPKLDFSLKRCGKLVKEKFPWKISSDQLKEMNWSIFRASTDREKFFSSFLDEQYPESIPSALSFDSKFKLHVLADPNLLLLAKHTTNTFTLKCPQPSTQKHTNSSPDTSFSSFVSRKKQKLQEKNTSNFNDSNVSFSSISQLMIAGMDSSNMTERNMSSIMQNQKALPPVIKERVCNFNHLFPKSQHQIKTIVVNYELIDSQILSGLYANDQSLNIIELGKDAFQASCEIIINPDTCVLLIDVFRFFQKCPSSNELYYIPIVSKLLSDFQRVYCLITNIAVNSAENAYKCQTVMQSLYSANPEVLIFPTYDSKMTVSSIFNLLHHKHTFHVSAIANLNNGQTFDEMLLLGMGFNYAIAKHILTKAPNLSYIIEHLDDGLIGLSPQHISRIKNALLTPFSAFPEG
ncbi:hypothetical protein ACO0QE_000922 [Hanseniaspora vineae]